MDSENQIPVAKRWLVDPKIPVSISEGLTEYPPLIRQLFFNRGITTADQAIDFLLARSAAQTDPDLLKDMSITIERLHAAVLKNEPIAVYGDYDVDGVTATALLVEVLRVAGAQVKEYIPNRFDEGYGLNNDALALLAAQGIGLVITVDCGVRSPREADFARSLPLDLIICDHHQPGPELPRVWALINPKQPGDVYPDKDLAGVGLAYKIAQSYLKHYPVDGVKVEDWLDLVALGTVADLAPLSGENRELVAAGLARIHAQKRQGLYSLAQVANLRLDKTTAGDIGYMLGPRLNAAGRLESALASFELLTATDPNRASELAQKLDTQNVQRQQITRDIQKQAIDQVLKKSTGAWIIFAADPGFNEGVVGLAASRLVEAYYRPAIVGHSGEEFTRASCRSIPEFHITEALDQCAHLLVRHGGHKAAAGFTVRNTNLPELIERLTEIAQSTLSGLDLHPILHADAELLLSQVWGKNLPDLMPYFDRFQPFGIGNPEISFISRNLKVKRTTQVGKEGSHLKLKVTDDHGVIYDAIAFRQGYLKDQLAEGERIDLFYTLELNEYKGQQSLQLNVKDINPVRIGS
jgi:single-stranded-DNA-specific exonuclease